MKSFAAAFLLVVVFTAASQANGQAYVGYMPAAPAVVAYYAPPVVAYRPVVTTAFYAPTAVYYPPAPAPYYVAAPVATPYYVAAPVVPAPVAVAPVYGRAVIVRPKVYVVGQPVRNVLRAVTP